MPIPIPIPDALLRAVYASDQAMYPVALSYSQLRAWVAACPDLCICFRDTTTTITTTTTTSRAVGGGSSSSSLPSQYEESAAVAAEAAGVVIVLPLLRVYWEDLLQGRLKEPDIDPGNMFPVSGQGFGGGDHPGGEMGVREGEEEVGLHVYHIERFGTGLPFADGRAKRFSEFALEEVMARAQARSEWRVVGMSALTATPAGKRTFERLGFAPTGYRELFVAKAPAQASRDDIDKQPGPLEMICLYPGDEPECGKVTDGGVVISMSEMTVRYKHLSQLGPS
ncbi:hypothetical protein C8A01DRAFT_49586 [Parachaetomium inaequale]|uniref:Uncharacterized protein n=1 Tax=Parachaetomium inaequale TaxID=2588326 RepID=A0AAN6PAP9_9PEZI|nr:hypothetical protein C8A01DRAFT_49586 [Parachaetomium inaequale]